MDYTRFSTKSIKARMSWVQQTLGVPVTCKRDKATIKALTKFQKEHGLVGNGSICEKTFNLLYDNGGSEIDINKRV